MATISDYDHREREDSGHDTTRAIGMTTHMPDRDPDQDLAASVAGDSVAGNPAAATNPRKRKKSSRACDFCHVNHQPCDNAKPRCSYCERHNKSCLYLRPQKKRGPAQGYRSALHTLRESAAAWGAALNLIPSLGPVVEGYLKQPEGRRLVKAIKDPTQQEFFIQAWQQSGVFKTFFPDESPASGAGDDPKATPSATAPNPLMPDASPSSIALHRQSLASHPNTLPPASGIAIPPSGPPGTQLSQTHPLHGLPMSGLDSNNPFDFVAPPHSHDGGGSSGSGQPSNSSHKKSSQEAISLSDIVAKDAARSSLGFSQTLGSLGFAPNETLEDFLDMTYNPEPTEPAPAKQDSLVESDQDQRAYYELLMGRRFS
ncbi:unnamed protein product [Discula destructiva]